jgi:hypothetical protein
MALNLNVTPYFDDYDINKGYLKILFKPGNSVQAREMTQMQSLLQKQIANLSDHFFKDGAMVIPGAAALDSKAGYVKIDLPTGIVSANSFVGQVVQGKKTGIRALVVNFSDPVDLNNDNIITAADDAPATLYVKYLEGVAPAGTVVDGQTINVAGEVLVVNGETVQFSDGQSGTFVEGEDLIAFTTDGTNLVCEVQQTANGTLNPIGVGSLAFIEQGIYYVKGNLVQVNDQSIILDKYSNVPTYKIGLEIHESIASYNDDSSLLDNSLGSTNFNSPGADRYKIELVLTKRDIDAIDTNNFIELISVRDGKLNSYVDTTPQTTLLRNMARRTYDQAGDFTVTPFPLDIREYYNENFNDGVFTMKDMSFANEAGARAFALSEFPNDIGMVTEGLGEAHTISSIELALYPEQNLDTTGTLYYPGRTHENLLEAMRTKLALGVENGKAYVRGFEIERKPSSNHAKYIPYQKSRTNYQINNKFMPVNLGAFMYVSDMKGVPEIDATVKLVNMHISDDSVNEYVAPQQNIDLTTNSYLVPATYDEDSTFFEGGGNLLGANTYGTDVIATARVKAIEYFDKSSSGAMSNNYSYSIFKPIAGAPERGIWKVYLYDIQYKTNPRTNVDYLISDARSLVSEERVTPTGSTETYLFASNILTKLQLTDMAGNFTTSSMIFDKYNIDIRAMNYYWDYSTGVMLVKSLNYGNHEISNGVPLPTGNLLVNEVINEGVPSSGGGVGTNAFDGKISVDIGTASARIFSSTVLHGGAGSSMVNIGLPWVKTVKNVNDVTGVQSSDTQYNVIRKFDVTMSSNVARIDLTDPNTSLIQDEDLIAIYYNAGGSAAVGLIGSIVGDVSYDSDLRGANITVGNLPVNSQIKIHAPVRKVEMPEKSKTLVSNNIELPFTLKTATGTALSEVAYDNTVSATNATTSTYDADVLGQNYSVSTGVVNPTFTVGASGDLQLSLSQIQISRPDIANIQAIYDTCNVTNTSYSISILASDNKFIHEMDSDDFKFARNAYEFYEKTGQSPFNVDIDINNTISLAALETLLTVSGIRNPFAQEITEAWAAGGNLISDPTQVPVKINDITARYELFNGQKPSCIDLGELFLKPGMVPCGGRPIVIYDYYHHGIGDYSSVDSYSDYESIGSFGDSRLSDVIDFRPALEYQQISGYPIGKGVVSSPTEYPIDGTALGADIRVYLPRSDKLYMTKTGVVRLKYGSPSPDSDLPEDPTEGMVLYELSTRPYTLGPPAVTAKMMDNKRYTMRDIGKLEKRISNLEYYTTLNLLEKDTMDMAVKDENGNDRFKNGFIVDQFTNHTIGDTLDPDYKCSLDSDNNLMRPFFTEKSVNMKINFSSAGTSGYTIEEQKIYLDYDSIYMITQEKSSKTVNVNPFAIFTFKGSVHMFPSVDEWKVTNQAPDIVTDNREEYQNLFGALLPEDGVMGTSWNSWENNWTGRSSTSTSFNEKQRRGTGSERGPATPIVASMGLVRQATVTTTRTRLTGTKDRTGTQEIVTMRDNRQSVGQRTLSTEIIPWMRSRKVYWCAEKMKPNTKLFQFFDGINVSEFCASTTKITFDNVPTAVATFWRSQRKLIRNNAGNVWIVGTVSQHRIRCFDVKWNSAQSLEIHIDGEISETPEFGISNYIASEAIVIEYPNSSNVNGVATKNLGPWPSSSNISVGSQDIISDTSGFVNGIFEIPNNNNLRFKTGERIFKLTDQPNNGTDNGTEAQATYVASGLTETVADQIVLTRLPDFSTRDVADSEAITDNQINTTITAGGWYDPLAQTIMIDQDGGAFITAVELFFSTKDETKPVTCQIRQTVNGYPGPKILGTSIVYPNDVTLSDDGVQPTLFTFPSPIFVQDNTEYCIVIMADTQGYRAHVARMGDESLDGSGVISKQPYAGVFFKSQNASTWTADQMEDLKFRVMRAKFNTSQRAQVFLENSEVDDIGSDEWSQTFGENSMKITANSSKVTFTVPNSGGAVSTRFWQPNGYNYITLMGFHGTYDVFPSDSLNGSHLVTDTTATSFTIDLKNPFYPLGISTLQVAYPAGNLPIVTDLYTPQSNQRKGVRYKSNFKYDSMKPNIKTIELPNTRIDTYMKTLSGTSQDSINAPGVRDNIFTAFTPNTNINFTTPRMIATNFNEEEFSTSTNSLDRKSLVFKLELSSENDSLSPVIDTQGLSCILISNKTNSPLDVLEGNFGHVNTGFVDETAAQGGSVATKYITKEVSLDQVATSLRVICGVNRQDDCDIDFYYRIKTAEDQIFSKLAYTLIPRVAGYNNASADEYDFKEYDMDIRNVPEFSSVSVKIVLKTKNSSVVPKVRDLRIIALAS